MRQDDAASQAGDVPLGDDELIALAATLKHLPAADAAVVDRLVGECRRVRAAEARLLADRADAKSERETLAEDIAQIVLDAAEWLKTLWNVGYMGAGRFPTAPRSQFPSVEVEDILKSALLGRIRQGKRPLPFPPPTRHGVPWHEVVEEPGPFAVDASLVIDDDRRAVAAVIEGCSDWLVVDSAANDADQRVQHQGKGPIYRLRLDGAVQSTLSREPPAWTRRIFAETRGGMTRFLLEWPRDDGSPGATPLRAATWERAESEASYWIASKHPEMYGQIAFTRADR